MAGRKKIQSNVRARVYSIMELAVEEGVAYGWSRAHKYVENPSEDHIKENMRHAIMNSIAEYFAFDEAG